MIPHIPLAWLDDDILDNAKEIGLGKFLHKIENLVKIKFDSLIKTPAEVQKRAKESLTNKQKISIVVGPNNVHDILDSLD